MKYQVKNTIMEVKYTKLPNLFYCLKLTLDFSNCLNPLPPGQLLTFCWHCDCNSKVSGACSTPTEAGPATWPSPSWREPCSILTILTRYLDFYVFNAWREKLITWIFHLFAYSQMCILTIRMQMYSFCASHTILMQIRNRITCLRRFAIRLCKLQTIEMHAMPCYALNYANTTTHIKSTLEFRCINASSGIYRRPDWNLALQFKASLIGC